MSTNDERRHWAWAVLPALLLSPSCSDSTTRGGSLPSLLALESEDGSPGGAASAGPNSDAAGAPPGNAGPPASDTSAGGSPSATTGEQGTGAISSGGLAGATQVGDAASGDSAPGESAAGGETSTGGASMPEGPAAQRPEAAPDLCEAGVWDGSAPKVLALSGNTFAHDPTMVKVDATYYRFWTGDFIPMATSTDLARWDNAPPVYPGRYSPWVDEWLGGIPGATFNFPWAPDVSVFGGEVHLYSSFSARFGDNVSCITHLSTSDIASGNWTDHGPVICTEGNEPYNAIDADVALDLDGTPHLAFGSFWDGILAFELQPDGSRAGQELTRLAWNREIEAPVLFRRCGFYYLFVTWGLCCPGEGRSVNDLTYRVAVGRSTNILGPYVDRNGVAMLDGGGTLVTQGDGVNFAAAGHSDVLVDGTQIYHLYHAYAQSDGRASLRIAELYFNEEGWPVPHAP